MPHMRDIEWHTVIVTPPTAEPVTTAEMKDHLPLDGSDHDTLLDAYIAMARAAAEAHTKRQFITATWTLFLSEFPSEIQIPFPPLQSVTHVKYHDENGDQQTLVADTDYQVDKGSEPGRIKPAFNESWPSARIGNYEAVEVQFVAGYGAAGSNVDDLGIQAIKLHVADAFRIREDNVIRDSITPIPMGASKLLNMMTAGWFA